MEIILWSANDVKSIYMIGLLKKLCLPMCFFPTFGNTLYDFEVFQNWNNIYTSRGYLKLN